MPASTGVRCRSPLAAAVQALQAAGVLAAAVLAGISAAEGKSYQSSSGIALTVIGAGTAVLLALTAIGLLRVRRWSRTPALLTQLFTGIVGIYLVQGDRLLAWRPGYRAGRRRLRAAARAAQPPGADVRCQRTCRAG